MSTEINDESTLSKEEKMFNEYIRRGDDFFRIELFKSSREMYQEAQKLKPQDTYCATRIKECTNLIRRDTKRILFVLPFLIIIVGAIICHKSGSCPCRSGNAGVITTAVARN